MSAKSCIECRYRTHTKERIVQGDILIDLTFFEWRGFLDEAFEEPNLKRRKLSYLVILSQDCDLERDFENRNDVDRENDDKFLQSILVCPAYNAQRVKEGTHLAELDLTMQRFDSDTSWGKVKINNDPRYHYLKKDGNYRIPNLVVDFKHYHTIRRDVLYELYQTHYLASLNELFREELSHRFSFYLSRVGLPDFKSSGKAKQAQSTSEDC